MNQALESKYWEKTWFRSMLNRFHLSFYSHLNVDQCTQSTSNTVNKSSNVFWCYSEEQNTLFLVCAWSTFVLLLTIFDKLYMYVRWRSLNRNKSILKIWSSYKATVSFQKTCVKQLDIYGLFYELFEPWKFWWTGQKIIRIHKKCIHLFQKPYLDRTSFLN